MKPRYLIPIYLALLCNTAYAQTVPYVPTFCGAALPTGTDYTIGKDSGGKPCYKLANAKGFILYHGKEGITYQATIEADLIVIGESYIIFRKASKDVAWFDREFIVGWKAL